LKVRVGRQDRGKQTTSPATDIDYGIETAEIVRLGDADTFICADGSHGRVVSSTAIVTSVHLA
jgi:hypothetical protein